MRYDVVSSIKQVDLGSLTWTPYRNTGHYDVFSAPLAHDKTKWVTLPGYSKTDYVLYGRDKTFGWNSNDVIYVCNSEADHMSGAQFKSFIAGNIITFVITGTPRRFNMIISRRWISINDANITHEISSGRHFFRVNAPADMKPVPMSQIANISCEGYRPVSNDTTLVSGDMCQSTSGLDIILVNNNYTTVEDFKAAEGSKIVYYEPKKVQRFNFVKDTAQVDLGTLTWYKSGTNAHGFYVKDLPYVHRQNSWMSISGMTYNGTIDAQQILYPTDEQHFQALYDTSAQFASYREIYFYDADNITAAQKKAKMAGTILTYQSTLKETKV